MLFDYLTILGDNALILGHRLSEWCGHGPALEQDMALTNISLDLIGQARNLYQYAAKIEGKGRTEDDLAFMRDAWNYKNLLLTEQPNGDFAKTIARQFFYDHFSFNLYTALQNSKDEQLAAIATKSLKEVSYHRRWSSEWVIRLGDGTDISHQKMQDAIDELWSFTGELHKSSAIELAVAEKGIGVKLEDLLPAWQKNVKAVLDEATLKQPEDGWMQGGGKEGKHSEHLGFLLTEMQYLQRAYPGNEW